MTNSDNTYGTYNKKTQILTQVQISPVTVADGQDYNADTSTNALQTFSDVATAKSWFFTTAALTVFDECCTQLQWSVIDSAKLKMTMTFGTKGNAGLSAADDWAGQFISRKNTLDGANNWAKNPFTTEDSTDHLF